MYIQNRGIIDSGRNGCSAKQENERRLRRNVPKKKFKMKRSGRSVYEKSEVCMTSFISV